MWIKLKMLSTRADDPDTSKTNALKMYNNKCSTYRVNTDHIESLVCWGDYCKKHEYIGYGSTIRDQIEQLPHENRYCWRITMVSGEKFWINEIQLVLLKSRIPGFD